MDPLCLHLDPPPPPPPVRSPILHNTGDIRSSPFLLARRKSTESRFLAESIPLTPPLNHKIDKPVLTTTSPSHENEEPLRSSPMREVLEANQIKVNVSPPPDHEGELLRDCSKGGGGTDRTTSLPASYISQTPRSRFTPQKTEGRTPEFALRSTPLPGIRHTKSLPMVPTPVAETNRIPITWEYELPPPPLLTSRQEESTTFSSQVRDEEHGFELGLRGSEAQTFHSTAMRSPEISLPLERESLSRNSFLNPSKLPRQELVRDHSRGQPMVDVAEKGMQTWTPSDESVVLAHEKTPIGQVPSTSPSPQHGSYPLTDHGMKQDQEENSDYFRRRDAEIKNIPPKIVEREQITTISFLRDLLWLWLGCDQGKILHWNGRCINFRPQDKVSPTFSYMLGRLERPASLYRQVVFLLETSPPPELKFTASPQRQKVHGFESGAIGSHGAVRSLVLQNFFGVLRDELGHYREQLGDFLANPESSCTFSHIMSMETEFSYRLEFLHHLLRHCIQEKGGSILRALSHFSGRNERASTEQILRKVQEAAWRPFYSFLRGWLLSGERVDPYEEFFIEENSDVTLAQPEWWTIKFIPRPSMSPPPRCPLTSTRFDTNTLRDFLYVGQCVYFLVKVCGSDPMWYSAEFTDRLSRVTLSERWDTLLPRATHEIDKKLKDVIVEQLKLPEAYRVLYHFLLAADESFFQEFLNKIKSSLFSFRDPITRRKVWGTFFVACLQKSRWEEIYPGLSRVLNLQSPSGEKKIHDSILDLRINFHPTNGLNTFLSPYAMDLHQRLGSLLINLYALKHDLTSFWRKQLLRGRKEFFTRSITRDPRTYSFFSELWHFTSSLQLYITQHVYAPRWKKFQGEIIEILKEEGKFSLLSLRHLHENFAREIAKDLWWMTEEGEEFPILSHIASTGFSLLTHIAPSPSLDHDSPLHIVQKIMEHVSALTQKLEPRLVHERQRQEDTIQPILRQFRNEVDRLLYSLYNIEPHRYVSSHPLHIILNFSHFYAAHVTHQ